MAPVVGVLILVVLVGAHGAFWLSCHGSSEALRLRNEMGFREVVWGEVVKPPRPRPS